MDVCCAENASASCCQCKRSHKQICVIVFILCAFVICGSLVYWYYHKRGTTNSSSTEQVTGLEKCIYYTTNEFLKRLETDPFGDNCIHDSNDVRNCNRKNYSNQNCRSCDAGERSLSLPNICFCDKIIHCKGTERYDDPANTKSEDCVSFFRKSQYKERGNCTSLNQSINCQCEEGFTNFMCSSISKRLCKSSHNKTSDTLKDCRQSNSNDCVLKHSDSVFYCEVFTGRVFRRPVEEERNDTDPDI